MRYKQIREFSEPRISVLVLCFFHIRREQNINGEKLKYDEISITIKQSAPR